MSDRPFVLWPEFFVRRDDTAAEDDPMSGDMTAAFSEALDKAAAAPVEEASPVSTPAPESQPAESTPVAATAPPAGETTEPVTVSDDEPKREPPAWRWQDILQNTRESVAKETEARLKQDFEQQNAGLQDFRGMDATERAGLLIWNRALRGDPAALAQVERVNPSLAAALSGRAPAPAPAEPDPEPQPDAAIQLADGSTVPVYTAAGQARRDAWFEQRFGAKLEAQLAEKFKPALSVAERLQQQEQEHQQQAQTRQWATTVLSPLKRLPYFEEFKPALGTALAALPQDFAGSLEEVVFDAYARLHTAKLAELTKHGETNALASLQQRAVAGTIHPNSAGASTPQKFRADEQGFADAIAHFGGDTR